MSLAELEVPRTVEHALSPEWLTKALAPVTGGAPITAVETVETLRTMCAKIRFTADWDGGRAALCIKGMLDADEGAQRVGFITVRETEFYDLIAPNLSVRVPTRVASAIDHEAQLGVVVMRDLVAEGARFCTALEPLTADEAAQSLEQLARLHVRRDLLEAAPGIRRSISDPMRLTHMPQDLLQELMDDERGEPLPREVLDAARLRASQTALAERDAAFPQALIHGDCHGGNLYRQDGGFGLIDWQTLQQGGWALDVAYHICAALPVEVAEQEERALLTHYLNTMRSLGDPPIDPEEAWTQYRMSVVYGYYMWATTRRVDRPILNTFFRRLGAAVVRHDSFRLLGV